MHIVKIEKIPIGEKQPTYLIAEIGGNFNTFSAGKKIIDAAVKNGANAVKIQTFTAENLVSKFAIFNLPSVGGMKKQFPILKKLELKPSIQKQLFEYCKKKKITFFSTPSHKDDVDFLEENGICAYKLGSDDLTNLPLIKYVSKCNKPTIISTGMSNMKEVRDAVRAYHSTGNKKLILLHCVSMYPSEPKFANLKAIDTMKNEFKIPIGWSDHSIDSDVCIAATALGADVIEKHFMLNKKEAGPDGLLSADPVQFKNLAKSIRIIENSFGSGIKNPAKNEIEGRSNHRKSIVAVKNIKKGEKILLESIDIKRPATGIAPKYKNKILGCIAKKNIKNDMPIKESDIVWKN